MNEFFLSENFGELTVVFEDDGRVAYAYLIDEAENIVADVWLYNHGDAPSAPEWKDRSKAPFRNPSVYVRAGVTVYPKEAQDVLFHWSEDDKEAIILICGRPWAKLRPGEKPGECVGALKDGPLAKRWTDVQPT